MKTFLVLGIMTFSCARSSNVLSILKSRILKPGEDPIWKIEPGMEECTFPWIYPTGQGGELDSKRPIPLKFRDYCQLRLMSADKRWQSDVIWTLRAMNLIQRDDLCKAANYHEKNNSSKIYYAIEFIHVRKISP